MFVSPPGIPSAVVKARDPWAVLLYRGINYVLAFVCSVENKSRFSSTNPVCLFMSENGYWLLTLQ